MTLEELERSDKHIELLAQIHAKCLAGETDFVQSADSGQPLFMDGRLAKTLDNHDLYEWTPTKERFPRRKYKLTDKGDEFLRGMDSFGPLQIIADTYEREIQYGDLTVETVQDEGIPEAVEQMDESIQKETA